MTRSIDHFLWKGTPEGTVKTTFNIPDELMAQARAASRWKTKTGVVTEALEELVRVRWLVILPSPVATELLCGSRPGKDRGAVETLLQNCRPAVPAAEDYRAAGLAGAAPRRRGITVGTVELILAAVALRLAVPVWSADAHFRSMVRHGGPRLFEPRLPVSS